MIVIELTPDQQTWLKENFRLYTNDTLAHMLKVRPARIDRIFKAMGLCKRDMEGLTDEQKKFVRENYRESTVKEIAQELSVMGMPCKANSILAYLQKAGIKKYDGATTPPPKKKKIKRAAPDHTNTDHHNRINYWLNLQIEPGRKYSSIFQ
jgi:hypothetical protein